MMVFPRSVVRQFIDATRVSPGSLVIDATSNGSAFTRTLESLGIIIDRFDAETLCQRGRPADCVLFSASSDECAPQPLSWRLPVLLAQLRPRGVFVCSNVDADSDQQLSILQNMLRSIARSVPACATDSLTLRSDWPTRALDALKQSWNPFQRIRTDPGSDALVEVVRFQSGLRPMTVDEWSRQLDMTNSEESAAPIPVSVSPDHSAA